jgi:nucleoside 2-deoxyribosyltransferase
MFFMNQSITSKPVRSQKKHIYLAGPDVFFQDSKPRFEYLTSLCRSHGMEGVAPSDDEISEMIAQGIDRCEIARHIYMANVKHIQNCDGVIANMIPFRGDIEPDSGTVFEVGMAVALGKPVAMYLPQGLEDSGSRVRRICATGTSGFDGRYGALIEDFGLPLNLMLACSGSCFETPEEALNHLQTVLS